MDAHEYCNEREEQALTDRDVARRELDAARIEHSRMLTIMGQALRTCTLVTNEPMIEALRERMMKARPGDLVMEISRFGRTFDPDAIGRLVRIERIDSGEVQEDKRYVIEPLHTPGAEQGWINAEFVALPTDVIVRWATYPA